MNRPGGVSAGGALFVGQRGAERVPCRLLLSPLMCEVPGSAAAAAERFNFLDLCLFTFPGILGLPAGRTGEPGRLLLLQQEAFVA